MYELSVDQQNLITEKKNSISALESELQTANELYNQYITDRDFIYQVVNNIRNPLPDITGDSRVNELTERNDAIARLDNFVKPENSANHLFDLLSNNQERINHVKNDHIQTVISDQKAIMSECQSSINTLKSEINSIWWSVING